MSEGQASRIIISVLVSGVLTLTGCSSSSPRQVTSPGSPSTPPVAAVVADAPVPDGDQSWVTVYRKKRMLGAILNTSVHVDGIEVADLDPGTYVRVVLPPGTHSFYSDDKDDAVTLDLAGGAHQFFRVELQAGVWKGHGVLEAVDPATGASEFREWKLKLAKDIREPDMVIADASKP